MNEVVFAKEERLKRFFERESKFQFYKSFDHA